MHVNSNFQLFGLLQACLFLVACESEPKLDLSLTGDDSLHQITAGESMRFLVLDSSASSAADASQDIKFTEAHLQWLQWLPESIDSIPGDIVSTQVFDAAWELNISGLPRSHLLSQNDSGDISLLGIKTGNGNLYWIKDVEQNSYGNTLLSTDIISNEASHSTSNLNLETCELNACRSVGSMSWTTTYDRIETIDTPYAKIESHRLTRQMDITINNDSENIVLSYDEILWVYPPLGVVQRNLLGQYNTDASFQRLEAHIEIRSTDIRLEEVSQSDATALTN